MSAPLDALKNAILTNTLDAGQQTALANALAIISPLFPTPDEISNSIPFDEEELARQWIAALYAVNAGGGSGGVTPVQQGQIIVPTGAALSGTVVTGLPNGQQAIVTPAFGGSLWTLGPIGTLTPDGSTVLASTDATRVWERVDVSLNLEENAAQTLWFVDGGNVSGVASDENAGNSAGAPLLHVAEIFRRLGYTWTPTLDAQTVIISFLSPNGIDDPYMFAPQFVNSARLVCTGQPGPADFTGTLLAVTPKNRATNTPLQSTFTTTTGALVGHMVLVNTTRGNSTAIAVVDNAGTWTLSQPFAAYDLTGEPTLVPEVDTWANGDAIQGFSLIRINVGRLGGLSIDLNVDFGQAHILTACVVADPAGLGGADPIFIDAQAAPLIYNCVVERFPSFTETNTAASAVALSSAFRGQIFAGSDIFNSPFFRGGSIEDGIASTGGVEMSGDLLLLQAPATVGNGAVADGLFIGSTTALLIVGGNFSAGGPIYGSGFTLEVGQGTFSYNAPASTALPGTGVTYEIGGSGDAYSNLTTAGLVATHKVTGITAALLDAPAGAAGYGGLAYIPGVGGITAFGSVP